MMGRVAAKVTCSDQDRAELERLSASRTEQARKVERARMVLGCLARQRNDTIAQAHGAASEHGSDVAQAIF